MSLSKKYIYTRKYNRFHKGRNNETSDEDSIDIACPVCLLTKEELIDQNIPLGKMISCNHEICKNCLDRLPLRQPYSIKKCPLCNQDICSLQIQIGDAIHEYLPNAPTAPTYAMAMNSILDILGPNWTRYDNFRRGQMGFRYTANRGQGIALPVTRTWYGCTRRQRFGVPITPDQLQSINNILAPLNLEAIHDMFEIAGHSIHTILIRPRR